MYSIFEAIDRVCNHIEEVEKADPVDRLARILCTFLTVPAEHRDAPLDWLIHSYDNPPTSTRGFGRNEAWRFCQKFVAANDRNFRLAVLETMENEEEMSTTGPHRADAVRHCVWRALDAINGSYRHCMNAGLTKDAELVETAITLFEGWPFWKSHPDGYEI